MTHVPVLRSAVLSVLLPMPGETVCDLTVGLGGHAEAFLEATAPGGRLIALDADSANLELASKRLSNFGDRVQFSHGNFRDVGHMALPPVDILFADLGVSSPHLDDPARGFSFRGDGALDMRLDRSRGETAAAWIARSQAHSLADVLQRYGEVRWSMRIAEAIIEDQPETTAELRASVERTVGWRAPSVLPQVFQAIRIAVNDELGALELLLALGPRLLREGGRFGVITFHSLEDRMVKRAFRALCEIPRDERTGAPVAQASFTDLTRRPITPSPREVAENPRSRSAKIRAIRRSPVR